MTFRSSVHFKLGRKAFESAAAILTCLEESLVPTFQVVAVDIAKQVNASAEVPAPRRVSQLFSRWEELLRRGHALSSEEEVGLWGELWMILAAPDVDAAVSAWRGPTGAMTDFAGGGIGVECKATFRRLEHYFSQEQLVRPLGDTPVYVASILVDRDQIDGKTLNNLVEELREQVAEPPVLEELLLEAGYSSADASRYTQRLRILEPPLWFPIDAVPRVRSSDSGVSRIRFVSRLDGDRALAPGEGIALLARMTSRQGQRISSSPST